MFLFIIRNTRLHTHSHSHMIRTHRHAHSFTQLINVQIFNSAHKDRHTQSRNRTSTQVNYHMHTHAHHCLFIKGQRYIIVSFPSLYQANKTISFHPSAPELLPSCRLRNVSLKTTSPGVFFFSEFVLSSYEWNRSPRRGVYLDGRSDVEGTEKESETLKTCRGKTAPGDGTHGKSILPGKRQCQIAHKNPIGSWTGHLNPLALRV